MVTKEDSFFYYNFSYKNDKNKKWRLNKINLGQKNLLFDQSLQKLDHHTYA